MRTALKCRNCCLALCALRMPLYSCHKPTLQEQYAAARHCYVAYDAALKLIAPAAFEHAGLDPALVKDSWSTDIGAAYDMGKELGMSPEAVGADLERARLAYLGAHSGRTNAAAKLAALKYDVNDCLGDDYGRPND